MPEYNPQSHFFVDHTTLSDAKDTNIAKAKDAFGPVTSDPTMQYRTTSVVRATTTTKVFAICNGRILIQPMIDGNTPSNSTKVNLILKPEASYAPLKIKYFIYRGVNKADLIFEDDKNNSFLKPTDLKDSSQPTFIQKLWADYNKFNNITDILLSKFPVPKIGYAPDKQTGDSLIEWYFHNNTYNNSTETFNIPRCKKGEYIGNFDEQIGLDIVLDYGDYQLEYQEELFKLDLTYARKSEHVFDVITIPVFTPIKRKRYKEYIHQFIDAAAFWGSHIECGKIILHDNKTGIKAISNIYNTVLEKFQNKTKIYIYIQAERGRSYNYYDLNRKVSFEVNPVDVPSSQYETNGWPVLIKEYGSIKAIQCLMQYNINPAIPLEDRHISIDIIAPGTATASFPKQYKPDSTEVQTTPKFQYNIQVYGQKSSCASFLFINCNLTQAFPIPKYYDDLWLVNIKSNYTLLTTNFQGSVWATYDKGRMVNLSPILELGANIQNKVVFDTGMKNDDNGATYVKRRLFIAITRQNTQHESEFDKLNIFTITSGIDKNQSTPKKYASNVYNDKNFSVYKGTFEDGQISNVPNIINSLSLIHDTDFERKSSYFQLGITDQEYYLLLYNNSLFPVVIPPDPALQYLPIDAENVYFHLEEIIEDLIALEETKDFRRFKVGLKYEDRTGVISSPLFPTSPENDVFVYTVDGFYFFSKAYSEYQQYFKEFAKAKVEFRPRIEVKAVGTIPGVKEYNGEFGFDWLRIGDNGEPPYKDIIQGGYERPSIGDLNTEYEKGDNKIGNKEAYKALKQEYKTIPTTKVDIQYYIPYLNLFSKKYSDYIKNNFDFSLPVGLLPPPFEAYLRVLVEIDEPLSRLEFDYDSTYFTINNPKFTNPILTDKEVTAKHVSLNNEIKITCKQDFTTDKQIRIIAYPAGTGAFEKRNAKLAGIITLRRNGVLNRKEVDVVFVPVTTNVKNIKDDLHTGSINAEEANNLYKSFYQSMIYANINYASLSLQNDDKFQTNGQYIDETYLKGDESSLFNYLKLTFLHRYPKYRNYLIVYIFNLVTRPTSNDKFLEGWAEGLGKRSVIVVERKGKSRNVYTLCHEALHGLGLLHTHRDGIRPITNPVQKYIYPYGLDNPIDATDNYMSYNSNPRLSLWQWQLVIIHYNLNNR